MTEATCGSGDFDEGGYKVRCDAPAPYRADFSFELSDGQRLDYSLRLCPRHAATDRTRPTLRRIYTAVSR